MKLAVVGMRRGRGRSKKSWREVCRHEMMLLQLTKDMTLDRRAWKVCIGVEE